MIGPSNTALLRHVDIRFPGLGVSAVHNLIMRNRGPESPSTDLVHLSGPPCDLVVSNCSGLTSITLAVNVTDCVFEKTLKGPLTIENVAAGIEAIDRRLRQILTLRKITVRIYEKEPTEEPVASVLAIMRRHGWIVSAHFWAQNDKIMNIDDFKPVQRPLIDLG
jgi:hypothetical protein